MTAAKNRWAYLDFAEARKLQEARRLAQRRSVADRAAEDYADPIYRAALLERQRTAYHQRKGVATPAKGT